MNHLLRRLRRALADVENGSERAARLMERYQNRLRDLETPPETRGKYNPPRVGWTPPANSELPNAMVLDDMWAGLRAIVGTDGANDCLLEGTEINKVNAAGQWGTALFRNCEMVNERTSHHFVGILQNQPLPIEDGETWQNSDRATPWGGWLAFENCHWQKQPGDTGYGGMGAMDWLHPQSVASIYVKGCEFNEIKDHAIYAEWLRHIHVEDCVFHGSANNTIQLTSRGGRVGALSSPYGHGNPLCTPFGMDGWAYIKDIEITEKYHGYRDSSDITIAGCLGPVVIDGVDIKNTISALAVWTDHYRGAWLANGDTIQWNKPVLWRKDLDEPPTETVYSCPEIWIDNFNASWDEEEASNKEMVMITGVKEIHMNRFNIGGPRRIVFNARWGGPIKCGMRSDGLPDVKFYDADSVWAHEGRLGMYLEDGDRYHMFTHEELEKLIVR